MRSKVASLVAVALVVVSNTALTDGTIPPKIYEIVQEGQDVEVLIGIGNVGPTYTLKRKDGETLVTIFEEKQFQREDSMERRNTCMSDPYLEYCNEKPEYCSDCDDDGVLECADGCTLFCTYAIGDECVPPGRMKYILSAYFGDDESTIDVEDTNDPCLEDDNGCAVSSPGGRVPSELVLFVFLMMIGLVVLSKQN